MTDKPSEQNRTAAERAHDQEADFGIRANEAAVNSGAIAMRAMLLINGGAAVAMLAFIGSLVTAQKGDYSSTLTDLVSPLIWFAWGVASAAACAGLAYITNYCIASSSVFKSRHNEYLFVRKTKASKRWFIAAVFFQIFAVSAAVGSLFLFVYGMLGISDVITNLNKPNP